MSLTISSLATVMVQVPIQARLNGQANYDPTGDRVELAFVPGSGKPASADWVTGSWTVEPGPEYLAQCLVGPADGAVLNPGTYRIWVRITDNPEQPVLEAGRLIIE